MYTTLGFQIRLAFRASCDTALQSNLCLCYLYYQDNKLTKQIKYCNNYMQIMSTLIFANVGFKTFCDAANLKKLKIDFNLKERNTIYV